MASNLAAALVTVFQDLDASIGYREFDTLPEAFQSQIIGTLKAHDLPMDKLDDVIEIPLQCVVNEDSEVCIVNIFYENEGSSKGFVEGIVLYSFDETTEQATKIFERIG